MVLEKICSSLYLTERGPIGFLRIFIKTNNENSLSLFGSLAIFEERRLG